MWMLPLYLHVNQKSEYDEYMMVLVFCTSSYGALHLCFMKIPQTVFNLLSGHK